MFQKNGRMRLFLYAIFFAGILCLQPACNAFFSPKILRLTLYPGAQGYLAMINVTGMRPVLLVQDPGLANLKQFLEDLKTEGNTPRILVLGTLNSRMMQELEQSGIFNELKEFHYPDMNQKPEYLKEALVNFKKRKIKSGPLRQNRYLSFRHADLIMLAPHEYTVYDENTRITFKLIRGKKSFVLTSDLTKDLLKILVRTYGKGSLRTDVLIGTEIGNATRDEVTKLFGKPQLIFTSEIQPKTPLRFRTEGNKIERL